MMDLFMLNKRRNAQKQKRAPPSTKGTKEEKTKKVSSEQIPTFNTM